MAGDVGISRVLSSVQTTEMLSEAFNVLYYFKMFFFLSETIGFSDLEL